jgi:hypothetical protein
MNPKRSVLRGDSRLAYLIGYAKRSGKQKYVMLTLKEAEDLLAYLRTDKVPMPVSVRIRD